MLCVRPGADQVGQVADVDELISKLKEAGVM